MAKTTVKTYVKRDGTRVRAHYRGLVVWGIEHGDVHPDMPVAIATDDETAGDGEGYTIGHLLKNTSPEQIARDYVQHYLLPWFRVSARQEMKYGNTPTPIPASIFVDLEIFPTGGFNPDAFGDEAKILHFKVGTGAA